MWREHGLTMVVVTHDSTVARRAQRIGVMKNGRLTFKQKAARTQPADHRPVEAADSSPADSVSFPD
jgi:ABC-type lipoprotein export system ATPase subunit